MLLGKRSRPAMKRTTSMTEIMFDLSRGGPKASNSIENRRKCAVLDRNEDGLDHRLTRGGNESRDSEVTVAHFLKACAFCKRQLVPGRDIYMYRGDGAFCSLECRQRQMNLDVKKEKFALLASSKKVEASSSAGARFAAPAAAEGRATAV